MKVWQCLRQHTMNCLRRPNEDLGAPSTEIDGMALDDANRELLLTLAARGHQAVGVTGQDPDAH